MNRKTLLLLGAMFCSILSVSAQGGTVGDITWNIENDTLTFSGKGDMPDYLFNWERPWDKYSSLITTVIIETGITSIGENTLNWFDKLTSVSIPNSVTSIGAGAFYHCIRLSSIIIPNSVTTIKETVFGECENLVSIDIPKSVTSIACCAFVGCIKLTSITIPNSIKRIESHTFYFCKKLTSVTIPCSVKNIEQFAFMDCEALSVFTVLNPEPFEIYIGVFLFTDISRCTLRVPIGSVEAYRNYPIWSYFGKIEGIEVEDECNGVSVETLKKDAIKIYPNPTRGKLKIESDELWIQDVVIYDVFGKIQKIENWKSESTIDISHLSAGMYFVNILTKAGEVTRKVLKE